MNDELKSIAQLAQELGVTRQAIYQRLKGKELAKAVKPYVVRQGNACKYDLQAHDKASLKAFSKALPELGTVIPEVSKIAENVSEYAKNKEEDKSKTVEYETRAGHAGAVMREPDRATDHKDVEPDEPDLTDDL